MLHHVPRCPKLTQNCIIHRATGKHAMTSKRKAIKETGPGTARCWHVWAHVGKQLAWSPGSKGHHPCPFLFLPWRASRACPAHDEPTVCSHSHGSCPARTLLPCLHLHLHPPWSPTRPVHPMPYLLSCVSSRKLYSTLHSERGLLSYLDLFDIRFHNAHCTTELFF